jgi:hypothetical protein
VKYQQGIQCGVPRAASVLSLKFATRFRHSGARRNPVGFQLTGCRFSPVSSQALAGLRPPGSKHSGADSLRRNDSAFMPAIDGTSRWEKLNFTGSTGFALDKDLLVTICF